MSQRKVRWDSHQIRALRQHLKMSQAEMAQEMGTRQQTISEWETGIYQPRGASATLLNIIAERSNFNYEASREEKQVESSL